MRKLFLFVLMTAMVCGCAAHDRIVLLPDPGGRTGAVTVKTSQGETLLDQPYLTADVAKSGAVDTRILKPEEVNEQFGTALKAQPMRPVSFTLYFTEGKDELTNESKPLMESVKKELAQRPAPEITVIGHTDRVGSVASNDALSLKRAEAVRQALVASGIAAVRIEAAGRGEREPLVPTEDEVAEPRNRRVEISVR
jgi:outer membrane protein OmpA-like peptidoglycan-associated protein